MEDPVQDVNTLQYTLAPEPVLVQPHLELPEWQINKISAATRQHYNSFTNKTTSVYELQFDISRPMIPAIIAFLVPVALIAIALASYIYRYEQIRERHAIVISTLISSLILYHFVHESMPPTQYLTLYDKFMIANIGVMSLTFFYNIYLSMVGGKLYTSHDPEARERLLLFDQRSKVMLFALWVIAIIWVILSTFM
jgi:hypothetical protein